MLAHETLGMGGVGVGQDGLPGSTHPLTLATVDHLGCQQADPAVTVDSVVPAEEAPAEGPGVLDGAEA